MSAVSVIDLNRQGTIRSVRREGLEIGRVTRNPVTRRWIAHIPNDPDSWRMSYPSAKDAAGAVADADE